MLHSFNIDLVLVVLFLIANLVIGLNYGKKIKSIRGYAMGEGSFSTIELSLTIIATWISGSSFAYELSMIYRDGILVLFPVIGQMITLILIAYILAPGMREFLGKLSIAEAMGDIYGVRVQVITAICAILKSIIGIAMQIKVFASIFNHFLEIDSDLATLISSGIVIAYSALGGVKAVIVTDVFQFIAFAILIPVLTLLIWQSSNNVEYISTLISTNPLFDIRILFNYHDPQVQKYYAIFCYCLFPFINPAIFHRMLIARSTQQVTDAFKIFIVVHLLFSAFTIFIGIILLSDAVVINANNLLAYIMDRYVYTGFKGLLVISVIAMVMSTADSCINTAAVIFSNDLCRPLGCLPNDEVIKLKVTRLFSTLVGLIGLFVAYTTKEFIDLLLFGASFYTPIVGVPLLFTLLGFRTTSRVVLSGIMAGIFVMLIWNIYLQKIFLINDIIPSTLANIAVTMIMHYGLGEKGGWKRSISSNAKTT